MTISVYTEKSFDDILHAFMVKKKKNTPESRHGGNIPQLNKNHI